MNSAQAAQAASFHVQICKAKPLFKKFLELPDNVRDRIYWHVLRSDGQLGRVLTAHGTVGDIKTGRSPFLLPAICFTKKSELALAGLLYVQQAKINVCCEWCSKAMLVFLDRILPSGDLGRHAVITVNYDYYTSNQATNDFSFDTRFLEACPEVKHLTITMSVWDIIERLGEGPTGGYRPLTMTEILAKKDFMSITKFKQIRYVWFRVVRAGVLHGEDVLTGMSDVCKAMLQIFHDQGISVYFRLNHRHLSEP